ncbi:MAG TPA: hypothetical protein DCY88_21110, partial [Cyanobacteria bacterium UBA11372]|nr:hypothetical protein [Cyanobacteria bacterium UBA11372]
MFLSWQDVVPRLLSVLLLIAINAFFVTAEFSFVSVRRSRINQLVESGDAAAKIVQKLQRNIDRVLSTTQLGITLSSLALGWIGERAMAVLVADLLARLPLPGNWNLAIAHTLAIPIAFLLIAYLQIVLGELCPKSVALIYSEQLARLLGPSSLAIARFFKPFIWILNQSTRFLLRLVGIRYNDEAWLPPVTSEELQLIISTSKESTGLEAEERELLSNVFEFGDVMAAEVMVPRTSIASIPSTATFQELLNEIATTGHSRFPVTGESLDDVVGIINFIELAEPLAQGRLSLDSQIQPWIRPAKFVPEYTKLSELLPMMQRAPQSIAVVVDEFGGTAGLLTLDDLIAEIIGDTGESDSSEELIIQKVDDQTFLIQAQINLSEFNELLDLDLPLTDEYQTLGGFLIYHLQKIPNQGETFHYKNIEFTIVAVEGPRLDQILVRRQKSAT